MRFAFTDDQVLFADTVRDILAEECPPSAVRSAWDDPEGLKFLKRLDQYVLSY